MRRPRIRDCRSCSAWGAAPANLLPRFVLGVQPLTPGWTRAIIRPNPGTLKSADGKVPTPRGSVLVRWENGDAFKLSLTVPPGMSAQVQIPADKNSKGVFLGGKPVAAHRKGAWWVLDKDVTGEVSIEAKKLRETDFPATASSTRRHMVVLRTVRVLQERKI